MCFGLGWFEQLIVWLIVVGAVVAILRLLVPWVTAQIGLPIIGQVLNIVLLAVIAIMVVYICFALIDCLLTGGHFGSLLPRGH